MAFERIKTVRGKKYKYLVENVWENGKTKQKIIKYFGRVDKQPERQGNLIPYGMYYFTRDGCEHCDGEETILNNIKPYIEKAGIIIPELQYINTSSMENPLTLIITRTPTLVVSEETGLFIATGQGSEFDYLERRIGGKRFTQICHEFRNDNIKELLESGKTYRELLGMGYNKEEIRLCQGKPPVTEREKTNRQKREETERRKREALIERDNNIKKLILAGKVNDDGSVTLDGVTWHESHVNKLKAEMENEECKDGACPVS